MKIYWTDLYFCPRKIKFEEGRLKKNKLFMKKRDFYFAIILLSVVGYAASVRMSNNLKIASEKKQNSTVEIIEVEASDSVKWVETPKSERLKSSALIIK